MTVTIKKHPNALNLLKAELAAHTHTLGKSIESYAKNSMKDGGTPHVPSQPYEPPHIDTKNLHESIMTETEVMQHETETRVGTNVDYGLDLELGRHVLPRPWLRPAFNAVVKGKRR